MRATRTWEEAKPLLVDTALESTLEAFERKLARLDFDGAMVVLKEIVERSVDEPSE